MIKGIFDVFASIYNWSWPWWIGLIILLIGIVAGIVVGAVADREGITFCTVVNVIVGFITVSIMALCKFDWNFMIQPILIVVSLLALVYNILEIIVALFSDGEPVAILTLISYALIYFGLIVMSHLIAAFFGWALVIFIIILIPALIGSASN